MIEKIIDGISEALYAKFGDEKEIYTDDVEQGLTEPCFLITCLNPTNERFLGERYFRTNPFMIQYFPKSETKPISECFQVLEELFRCLRYITVEGDLIAGTEMNGECKDGILNFRVNFNLFVRTVNTDEDMMEEYSVNTDVRKDL